MPSRAGSRGPPATTPRVVEPCGECPWALLHPAAAPSRRGRGPRADRAGADGSSCAESSRLETSRRSIALRARGREATDAQPHTTGESPSITTTSTARARCASAFSSSCSEVSPVGRAFERSDTGASSASANVPASIAEPTDEDLRVLGLGAEGRHHVPAVAEARHDDVGRVREASRRAREAGHRPPRARVGRARESARRRRPLRTNEYSAWNRGRTPRSSTGPWPPRPFGTTRAIRHRGQNVPGGRLGDSRRPSKAVVVDGRVVRVVRGNASPAASRWLRVREHLPTGPMLALLAASYAFRLPALLNARSTNSDAAVVGLQAMHMLRGELSPLLWGSGYQTSADAAVAALFFAVLGPSPLVLMLSALTLHVLSTGLAFAMLRRRFNPWLALLVVMPLVVSPSSVHSYALYPPRQLSLTLAMAAFWALDHAGERECTGRWGQGWLAAGGLLATLAVSADPYPMLLVPLIGLLCAARHVGRACLRAERVRGRRRHGHRAVPRHPSAARCEERARWGLRRRCSRITSLARRRLPAVGPQLQSVLCTQRNELRAVAGAARVPRPRSNRRARARSARRVRPRHAPEASCRACGTAGGAGAAPAAGVHRCARVPARHRRRFSSR